MKLLDVAELSPKLDGSWAGNAVERLLAIDGFNEFYENASRGDAATPFLKRCLDELNVSYDVRGHENLAALASGPCIVVANHPFGALEAVLFLHLLQQVRSDAKIMANYLLMKVPEVAPGLIPVDPFERSSSSQSNTRPIREALRHLKGGGVLGVFPSGTVSHWRMSHRGITDPPWSSHVAALAQRTGASILPVYFHGKNGWGFQLAGLIHPLIRTALLPRELMNKRGREVQVTVGKVLSKRQLSRFEDPEKLTAFVRAATYLLKETDAESEVRASDAELEPIAPAVSPDILVEEIGSLPAEAKLLTKQGFDVFLLLSSQAPNIVKEVGRLREVTFREVGEGTGKAADLDVFDEHYEHLVLWSPEEEAIVGAYRMARVDEVMRDRGLEGLYTASLYRFKSAFVAKLGGSLELGRSFIVSRHQKQRYSLMLLWCGIGAFISKHPQYHTLFGPVSMSQNYTTLSKQLLVWFFKKSYRHPVLARLVQAHRPFKDEGKLTEQKALISDCIQSIDDVSALMSEFEQDGKGVPVLFKQYLKMNALLLCFSVDESFSNVLDGLVIADLRTADSKILRRYFGDEGLKTFQDYHQGV